MILSRWPYIFIGCLGFVLVVAGLIVWRCCVHRRKKKEAAAARMRLPDTAPRSPNPHQVSFKNLENGDMEMREGKGYDNYHGSDYRPSFASSRTRV